MGNVFDDVELRNLEIDLRNAPARIQVAAPRTLRKAARLVEEQMKIDASGHRYLEHLPDATSWENRGPWSVEIGLGPDGSQGSLAHIIVYGSANNDPVYDHTAGLRRAEPIVLEMFGEDVEESTLGGDGRA